MNYILPNRPTLEKHAFWTFTVKNFEIKGEFYPVRQILGLRNQGTAARKRKTNYYNLFSTLTTIFNISNNHIENGERDTQFVTQTDNRKI